MADKHSQEYTLGYRAGYSAGYSAGMRRSPPAYRIERQRLPYARNAQQEAEVKWYRQHGRHPERIRLDRDGHPFVIGDVSWNVHGRPRELIEDHMPKFSFSSIAENSNEPHRTTD